MTSEIYYRAFEIFSSPATSKQGARRGLLPITGPTFYNHLKSGKFPQPDCKVGNVRLWSEDLIRSAVQLPDSGDA